MLPELLFALPRECLDERTQVLCNCVAKGRIRRRHLDRVWV